MKQIDNKVFSFLKNIKTNNDRDWFNENKNEYLEVHANLVAFSDHLLSLLNKHDNIETPTGKKSVMRIYRDVRFSKDKSPYKTYLGMGFSRATVHLRGGYYINIEPGNSFVGGGFWGPNKDDLLKIRKGIEGQEEEFRAILNDPTFIKNFNQLRGDKLKTCPKGFDKTSSAIDLLRYKQFLLMKEFTDQEILSPGFAKKADATFKAMRPFLDLMSDILTTDENGVPLFE